jgi:hypothetical protein
VRLERSVQLGAPAWPALAAGRWGGPVRVRAGDAEYAGRVALACLYLGASVAAGLAGAQAATAAARRKAAV